MFCCSICLNISKRCSIREISCLTDVDLKSCDCDCLIMFCVRFAGNPGGVSMCLGLCSGVERDLGFVLPEGISTSSPFGPAETTVTGNAGTCASESMDDEDVLSIMAKSMVSSPTSVDD